MLESAPQCPVVRYSVPPSSTTRLAPSAPSAPTTDVSVATSVVTPPGLTRTRRAVSPYLLTVGSVLPGPPGVVKVPDPPTPESVIQSVPSAVT